MIMYPGRVIYCKHIVQREYMAKGYTFSRIRNLQMAVTCDVYWTLRKCSQIQLHT